MKVTTNSVYYYYTDQIGSTVTITTANGTPCYQATFTPYGQEMATQTTCESNYKFTGYERDAETGLDYAFARYYNSRLGRFMSADQMSGGLADPQSLNRYAYVGNSPLSFVDPSGMHKCAYEASMTFSSGNFGCVGSGYFDTGFSIDFYYVTGELNEFMNPDGTITFESVTTLTAVDVSVGGGAAVSTGGAANNGTWNWIKNAARTIGNYIPVICGAGVYNTGGLQLTGGAATVTVRNIQVADTQAGYQSGTFGEINFGEGLQGGFGQALYSGGGKENYLFGGVGLNLPTVTEVSVSGFVAHTEGDPFLSNSIGIDFDGGVSVLGGSAAGYLNTSSLTSCLSGH